MKRYIPLLITFLLLPAVSHAAEFHEWLNLDGNVHVQQDKSDSIKWNYTDKGGLLTNYTISYRPVPTEPRLNEAFLFNNRINEWRVDVLFDARGAFGLIFGGRF